jgi:hypothetical protein
MSAGWSTFKVRPTALVSGYTRHRFAKFPPAYVFVTTFLIREHEGRCNVQRRLLSVTSTWIADRPHVKIVCGNIRIRRGTLQTRPLRAIRVRTALDPVIPARFAVSILVRGDAVSGCL